MAYRNLRSILCLCSTLLAPLTTVTGSTLDGLQANHPRLLFPAEREAELKALAATDPLLAELIEIVRDEAIAGLNEPVIRRRLDDPSASEQRMKDERRSAMYRIFNMGVTLRMTDDVDLAQQMADRIKTELLTAAGFSNWYPSHFLNIGEMSALMAVGYDWIYDYLTPAERQTIVDGIVRNGLNPGLHAYANPSQYHNWPNRNNNWNQVCNAGLVLAALAVADKEPEIAAEIIDKAVVSIRHSMANYVPDGAWDEGPTYWTYGTTYAALMLSGLRTALDDLRGIENLPGYEAMGKSGAFHIQTIGPQNLFFNFGDSKAIAFFSPVLFSLAQEFDQPAYAFYQRRVAANDIPRMRSGELMQVDTLDRFLALLVTWYDESGQNISYDDLPLDQHFRGAAAVGAMRGEWEDPHATYLGFKGGDNQADHGHMDIGTFVLDAEGVRWGLNLGAESYELPGYWERHEGGRRWNYYRLNNRGHNTLTINNRLQRANARVTMGAFESSPDLAYANIDMTAAYSGQASSVRRGYAMLERRAVLIQDRISGLATGDAVRWGMITPANIELQGTTAILTQDGKTLEARILEPEGAEFSELSTNPHDYPNAHPDERTNEGTTMLAVELTGEADATMDLVVLLTPIRDGADPMENTDFRPLDPPPPSVPDGAGALRRSPEANAFVRAGTHQHTNQMTGTAKENLRVKIETSGVPGNFTRESFIRFRLDEIDGSVTGANIRLHPTQAPGISNFIAIAGNNWEENTITFANRPNYGFAFDQWTPVAGEPSEIDVSDAVLNAINNGNTTISFAITAAAYHESNIQYATTHHPDASLHPEIVFFLAPTVEASAPQPFAHEFGEVPGRFELVRNIPTGSLTVHYLLGGTATFGEDYLPVALSATFEEGESVVSVVIKPIDDDMVEGDETVILTLQPSSEYAVGPEGTATIIIRDRPMDDWRFRHGMTDREEVQSDADLVGDGVTTLLRYALGLGPNEPARHRLPRVSLGGSEGDSRSLIFNFQRPSPPPSDLTYTIQQSIDLNQWTSVPAEFITVTPDDDGTEEMHVIIPEAEVKTFLRLKAEQL